MIKTRIYLTSSSHVDVQESFDEVNYVMAHSAPAWTFTLKLENGEPVCLARDHVSYFTTCDDGQQKQKTEQVLTYQEFTKAFNTVGQGHHASPSSCGGVVGVDLEGHLEAILDPDDCGWSFYTSARGYLRCDELALMADLASTPPELRGGFNDERGGKKK